MIRAILFDLDGTLVQSERLKAQAYAMAVQSLLGLPEPDARAIEAYRQVVGSSREVASKHIVDSLGLETQLQPLMGLYNVSAPWDVLTGMRKSIYDDMMADPQVVRDNQWPHTVGLLRIAGEAHCRTAVATMSQRREALHVLRALDLERSVDLLLAREDVKSPKPDPEIYLLAAQTPDVEPADCLVLEDSPAGVRAGVAAGMNVIAVATPFTIAGLHDSKALEHAWVVHDPKKLLDVVRSRIEEHGRTAH